MKMKLIGICFLTGSLFAVEPSAPPAYGIKSEQPQPQEAKLEEHSRNVVCIDCRGAQCCCSGDYNGDVLSECPTTIGCCCSALTKTFGTSADLFAEPDKQAQD